MERVVLLDEGGRAAGTADKATVHHEDTPLHLAFSCYLFNERGELMLTQRALSKRTWPGVWTNTCCGHPAPGETPHDAVLRRLGEELGLRIEHIELVLPRFRYRAVMGNGVVENEMCPVFRAVAEPVPAPNPAEVEDTRWVPWTGLVEQVRDGGADISPWAALQITELAELGPDPLAWPTGDAAELPTAAREPTTA
ncbi:MULTISPECIES: isopentenyl-diphosphate Delta-isomerase [Saccharopolyspora]|uniref:Isopentenyl-diphosphate Delta-isomerase n=1 Tax=Saccharopolyspora gregorii TaxID=33914 RepID=A0ABP6RXR4_9PSEU|nr:MULTISPECIES: isopentenyl-diphosphate Delta-isomerase [Saccharopolyspora]MCA1188169.1 isopentenyl-diphosphate Delta-isomerase [Saccharopolyspora sp. 6T]MCA1191268.1 isopentenyl-diphosphate Delta-isomerase [Saccharopolyspora sp. 6V]MCA1227053.1 isopentenyl-diphosphate Delta-isomerase [Saccharopolyspora sp. 6M]MCA1282383.1 isopentenyl-diphosphate Delta-isomerase [Saccharopolyspora sp. 7B]